jgi:hypothetical protein
MVGKPKTAELDRGPGVSLRLRGGGRVGRTEVAE